MVSTIYESVQNLERPRAAIIDKNNKDILYIAHRRKFSTYNFATKEVKLITGKFIVTLDLYDLAV